MLTDTLRKPLFFIAVGLLVLAFGAEIGAALLPGVLLKGADRASGAAAADLQKQRPDLASQVGNDSGAMKSAAAVAGEGSPPGRGIASLALLDGLLLYTTLLIGASMIVPAGFQAKAQAVVTFLVALGVLISCIRTIFVVLALVVLMVALLLAIPFGTIVYLIKWGDFDRGRAGAILGAVMTLKLAFAVCLVLSQQRFLQNGSLVRIILTSLLASVIITFLHGLVPGILVSITDGIAGIVVAT